MEAIIQKYQIDTSRKAPYEIHGGRRGALVDIFNLLNFKVGAEIGVEQGKFSKVLCEKIPGLKLYAIDAWTAYRGYRDHVSQEKLDGFYANTIELLEPYDCEVIKGFSLDVAKEFPDESLDFVFIDGNHEFMHVAQDIVTWEKKVRKGGIVAGHDFNRNKKKDYECHVKDVVQAYTYSHHIDTWFVVKGDKSPSWFYVKE